MKEKFILGLDVSTKCCGIALFNENGDLLELSHISPKVKPQPINKTEELIKKAELFKDYIKKYEKLELKHIIIEEPLLRSNNVNTVGVLLRFNGMITKICYDMFGVTPEYINTYEARKNAFPILMQPGSRKTPVLFGAYPNDVNKKHVIWELVSKREPQIKWLINKKGNLQTENFDMADAYVTILGYLNKKKLEETAE